MSLDRKVGALQSSLLGLGLLLSGCCGLGNVGESVDTVRIHNEYMTNGDYQNVLAGDRLIKIRCGEFSIVHPDGREQDLADFYVKKTKYVTITLDKKGISLRSGDQKARIPFKPYSSK